MIMTDDLSGGSSQLVDYDELGEVKLTKISSIKSQNGEGECESVYDCSQVHKLKEGKPHPYACCVTTYKYIASIMSRVAIRIATYVHRMN